MDLEKCISKILPLDKEAIRLAKERQAKLAKPPGSLGELEEISIRFAGITGKVVNEISSSRIIVMCADNGICEEGISSAPISVTAMQAVNMTKRKTGMSSLAAHFGVDVEVVDLGIATPYECRAGGDAGGGDVCYSAIVDRRIASGTKNFLIEPAMSREEVLRAIEVGTQRVKKAADDGIGIIGLGEMGIGNTTTSTAVLAALTHLPVSVICGRGGGLTDAAFAHKKEVIDAALKKYGFGTWQKSSADSCQNSESDSCQNLTSKSFQNSGNESYQNEPDVFDVLSKVGGFDIAAMCGAYIGAAMYRIPVVIDGFISVVAALSAARLAPACKDFMFASHISYEPGYKMALDELGLKAYLDLGMRLGEGSGCPIAFKVIESALAVMSDMALFGEESDIDDGYLDEIREGDKFSV